MGTQSQLIASNYDGERRIDRILIKTKSICEHVHSSICYYNIIDLEKESEARAGGRLSAAPSRDFLAT